MSRFLISKRRVMFLFILSLGGMLLFTSYWYLSLFIFAGALFLILNRVMIREIYKPCALFSSQREIKQYKFIVIGDCVKPYVYEPYCDKDTTLVFTSPDRTLNASCQILLHMISCINEGGTCIITHNSRNKSKCDYSLFDLPYLHIITRKELDIEYLNDRLRFPLYYETVKCMKLLLGIKANRYKIGECPNQEIVEFCKRKRISLIYLSKY